MNADNPTHENIGHEYYEDQALLNLEFVKKILHVYHF